MKHYGVVILAGDEYNRAIIVSFDDRANRFGFESDHGTDEDGAELEVQRLAKQAEPARCQWRPIAEIHEDYGPCVLINLNDPGHMVIGNNLDMDFDEAQWTHFAEVPKLTTEEAERLKAEMPQGSEI